MSLIGLSLLAFAVLSFSSQTIASDIALDDDLRPEVVLSSDIQDLTWLEKYGPQIDQPFSGPLSFSHLPYHRCLEEEDVSFDIAILGMPFDTGVTYRNGARFGPYAIRSGSRRQRESRGYTMAWGTNPYAQGLRIIDCGDVPVSPFDNALAVDQMEVAYSTLLKRPLPGSSEVANYPRIISLGGDHTIVLPILRALHKVHGPISVIHFDAHLDTWPAYAGTVTEQSRVTHGTFFYLAQEEGLMANNSIHGGIRCKLAGVEDLENDEKVGFYIISTDDIDDLGIPEIVRQVRERIGVTTGRMQSLKALATSDGKKRWQKTPLCYADGRCSL